MCSKRLRIVHLFMCMTCRLVEEFCLSWPVCLSKNRNSPPDWLVSENNIQQLISCNNRKQVWTHWKHDCLFSGVIWTEKNFSRSARKQNKLLCPSVRHHKHVNIFFPLKLFTATVTGLNCRECVSTSWWIQLTCSEHSSPLQFVFVCYLPNNNRLCTLPVQYFRTPQIFSFFFQVKSSQELELVPS